MTKIITVSREFGSGGRELGKRLSDALGFNYYDKEILEQIAKETNTSEWYVEKVLKDVTLPNIPLHFSRSFSYYSPVTKQAVQMLVAERNVIQKLAAGGNCIIVGRGASIILQEQNPFNIFVYADMESKIKRCRSRAAASEKLTDKEMEKEIRRIDNERSKSLELISEFKWGDKKGYHLCINTSGLSIKNIIPYIAEYAKYWLNENAENKKR